MAVRSKTSSAKAALDAVECPSKSPSEIMSPALAQKHVRVRGYLEQLAANAPQVLLIEGGSADEREAMALWWATRLNCQESPAPCLMCNTCTQFISRNNRDLFFLDGRQGSIKIDDVRAVRAVLGEPPRGGGKRIVIISEAQSLGIEAANALLKSLEEPRPSTSFVLLAPQREHLLPTLVSRSWVLTLAWCDALSGAKNTPAENAQHNAQTVDETEMRVQTWLSALTNFARTGTGWFEKTSVKGALNAQTAERILSGVQRALVAALRGETDHSALASLLGTALTAQERARLDTALGEAQEALIYTVNPALTLDWLATQLFVWSRKQAQQRPPQASRQSYNQGRYGNRYGQ